MYRHFLFAAAALLFSFSVWSQEEAPKENVPKKEAAPVLLKTGILISASALSGKPEISSPDANQKVSSPCWIELAVKPDAGRSVSIHDYVLIADGSEYPCIAVALDGDAYSGEVWKIEKMDGTKNFKMLFAVPSRDASYQVKFKLLPTVLAPLKLKLAE